MLGAIAEATCGVMVSQVEQLLADAETGAPARLWALVGELEGTIAKLATELAVARKRAKMEEEEKAEAATISRDIRTAFTGVTRNGPPPPFSSRFPVRRSPRSLHPLRHLA